MSFLEITKQIVDVGIMIVIAAYFIYRVSIKDKHNDEKFDKMFNKIINMEHNIDKELEVAKIEDEINNVIKKLMYSTDAGRAFLIRYHNGGKDLNGISFLKMSMTNEIVRNGIAPLMLDFSNQFRALFPWIINEMGNNTPIYITDLEKIKQVDYGFYTFLINRNVCRFGIIPIKNNNTTIGFLGIEYLRQDVNILEEDIKNCLRDKKLKIETLVNLSKIDNIK